MFALLLLANLADMVPMRWISPDPASLELIKGTPVNCLLLESNQWSSALIVTARAAGHTTLGVIRPVGDPEQEWKRAFALKLDGVVLEGAFEPALAATLEASIRDAGKAFIELPARVHMRFRNGRGVLGTFQGVWPGIRVEESGSTKAAPSGAPWIDTNIGFLRFARAQVNRRPVWIGNRAPSGQVIPGERYGKVYADAALAGARWILDLDAAFSKGLLAREQTAVAEWKSVMAIVRHFETFEWRTAQPAGLMALVQDVDSGALFSGGLLDMISVKHVPVRPVSKSQLAVGDAISLSKLAVNVDPASLTDEEKDLLRRYTSGGGTLLNGPPGWKFPAADSTRITLGEADVKVLDDIWKEVNTMTGRRNLGVRLFNVSSMLSSFDRTLSGDKIVIHLVNYSGYPVESVTVHALGKFSKAELHAPGKEPAALAVYDVEEATGVDIDKVDALATLVLTVKR